MTVNFEEVKELAGQKVVVHCDTKEKAEDLLGKLEELGYRWRSANKPTEGPPYETYGKETCYEIDDTKRIGHSPRRYFVDKNYRVYKYEIEREKERGLKIHELVEGVEYKVKGSTIRYRIIDDVLEVKGEEKAKEWYECTNNYNYIVSLNFEECEFKPKHDDYYYYPSPSSTRMYRSHRWRSDEMDHNIKRNVGVYRTKEQAIKKAKELGWS